MITILGIHDGHNSGATILQDGQIKYSISEERLTRKKNEIGYPKLSIEEVLKLANIESHDIDVAVYASNFMHSASYLENVCETMSSQLQLWYLCICCKIISMI